MKQLRPGTIIKDDAIPILLCSLRSAVYFVNCQVKQPTFVTINYTDFGRRISADERYCIVCFSLSVERANEIPLLLRRLFSLPEFKTKAERMGKVALVSQRWVRYYQTSNVQISIITYPAI